VIRATPAVVLAIVMLASGARGIAHELGPTRVHVALDARGTFEVALVGDPEVLLARLEALAGLPAARSNAPSDGRLRAVSTVLLQNLQIRFDGAVAAPSMVAGIQPAPEESPGDNGKVSQAIVLRGVAPQGARRFSWQCGFLYGSYPVIVLNGGRRAVAWAQGIGATDPIELTGPTRSAAAVWTYMRLGVTHVVPGGLDHVLFVVGVCLLSLRFRDVVTQVSAFTLAHSLTLGLSLVGVVSVPAAIVEPLIALSIAYVAVENVVESRLRTHRLVVVVTFGLLHGLGFAGVLSEIGVAPGRIFQALLGFNAGVELGQLSVVGAVMAIARPWSGDPVRYRQVLAVPASCALAITGICWTVIRLVS
jgi:hydrogenase/urease accessory protein HupE